ncbi:capsule biosynthesis protein [Bacteroides sp. 214]|uniref:SLBB domain-containing protein n=1 Tax=Bacteroides sp. 214 TaxID=2302935 RepID=UPI0013D207C1|nr:SLBB domain-containing protein [Bacteroides sp. 214]NDW11533.1 capsule biosynthesis protein [Bacteroides sp. 214]
MRKAITCLLLLFAISTSMLAQRMTEEQIKAAIASQSTGVVNEDQIKATIANQSTGVAEQQRTRNVPDLAKDDSIKNNQPKIKSEIFGKDLFANNNLSFEPSTNMATPANYRLGPGDEVIVDIWGNSETTIRQTISPEGSIQINKIGPVYLSGMTVQEAEVYMQRVLSKIYETIGDETSQIRLTLGQNRTIQIIMMGEVSTPGTYALSSFSTVFHALYRAGGINSIGGMRSIQLIRNGKKIADIDVYDYVMDGKVGEDIRLMEGDVIMVLPYNSLVRIQGKVKRPMTYEMKEGETAAKILEFAGGFVGDAYKQNIRLMRQSEKEKQVFTIEEMDYSLFPLQDGDTIDVGTILDRYENKIEVIGAVYREGTYQLSGNINSVKQLIQKADGLRGDAFMERAQLQREKDDLSLELISIDLRGIINGAVPDIPLQRNDVLSISSIHDLKESPMLKIHGLVANPGTYTYAEKMSVKDLILKSGGLLEAASVVRIDIARRIKNPESEETTNLIGKTYSFDMKDGYIIGGSDKFILEPFDEVYVRRSPAYQEQRNVTVTGEVVFGGVYALNKKNERLSDLVDKAGGITPDAFVNGARLMRQKNEEELRRSNDALSLAAREEPEDSVSIVEVAKSEPTYSVGINLQKALDNPGSDFDLVLREGDELIIPEYINTVRINGAVMHPNTVLYKEGESFKYYLDQVGGYTSRAKKRRAYVVYMNGTVARLKGNTANKITPGCEIIIPNKGETKKMTVTETISVATSLVSLVAIVIALLRK